MDIYEIIQNLTSAVAGSNAISSWVNIAYGHDIKTIENMDGREMPLSDDCPLVMFFPVRKTTGTDLRQKEFVIGVSLLVYDDSTPVDINDVKSFTGGRNVEVLRQLVLSEIIDNLKSSGILHLEKVDMDYNPIEQYPYNDIAMELLITAEQVIGGNYYE